MFAPRRTSHGRPTRFAPRGSRRQRPVMRRWLRSTTPPSKRSSRFLPTASTDSSRRPSSRSAIRFTAARGCGVSTSTRSPTSGCSRAAARRSESPSGTASRVAIGFVQVLTMPANLNIAALSQRTGIPPDTLRKWEQRYGVLQPDRTAGGQRRYSELDVARIEWLRERLGGRVPHRRGGVAARRGAARAGANAWRRSASALRGRGPRRRRGPACAPRPDVHALSARTGADAHRGTVPAAASAKAGRAASSRSRRSISSAPRFAVGWKRCWPMRAEGSAESPCSRAFRASCTSWACSCWGRCCAPTAGRSRTSAPTRRSRTRSSSQSASMRRWSVSASRCGSTSRSLAKTPAPAGATLVLGGHAASDRVARRLGARHVTGNLRHSVRELRRLAR